MQVVRSDNTDPWNNHNVLFCAEVPAMGYAVYRFFDGASCSAEAENHIQVSETTMENDRIRAEFDPQTGDLRRLLDKSTGTPVVDHPCRAVLLDETDCDTWAHDRENLGPTVDCFRAQRFGILEQGPIRGAIRITGLCGNSTLIRTYSIHAGSDQITVQTKVDFHEQHKALKFTFPLTEKTVTAKIPCGTIRRAGYTGEEPCQSWIASGRLCVANDSKYGYDTEDGEMRLTVLRGAIYANHFGQRDAFCEFMDQGIHEFTYSIFPFRSISDSERKASELNFPLRHILGGFHDGKLPETMTCLEQVPDNIRISAVKQQEDGAGIVLRLYEMEGQSTDLCLKLFGKEVRTTISPYSLQTLDDTGKKLNAMEWTL